MEVMERTLAFALTYMQIKSILLYTQRIPKPVSEISCII